MSTNTGMSSCCLSGTLHSGTPAGKEEIVGDLPTYVSEPESKSKAQVVIFLTDIFGYKLPNVRLLADQYAKAGFYALVPDILDGDPLPESFLQTVEPPLKDQQQEGLVDKAKNTVIVGATLPPWLLKHTEAVTLPRIDGFIDHLRSQSDVGKIGVVGFCFGGRYAVLTAYNKADAALACHPALLSIPGDFEPVKKPLSIAVGTKDSLLDDKSNDQIKEFLSKSTVPTEVIKYEDQVHGFALRGDWSSEKDKKAMDDVQQQGFAWFKKYLV